ncbi:MAG TPA: hypothetical protein VF988_07605 [Verrucomicrobiae bacterium]
MKRLILTAVILFQILATAQASLFIQGSMPGQSGASIGSIQNATILDGNLTAVTVNAMDLSSAALGSSLVSLTVSLNITGGMNNGLYGWLVAPNGATVTLMNQPGYAVDGYGATGPGMQIALVGSGGANGDIQSVTSGFFLGGTSYPTYNAAVDFSGLTGINPNGVWTIYFSDTISGGGDSTLAGWSLNISSVPEPVNVALGSFGVLFVVAGASRFFSRKEADSAARRPSQKHRSYFCTVPKQ